MAYGQHQYYQCLRNRQMAFSDLTRQKKNWLTITMHHLAAPPNRHCSKKFVGIRWEHLTTFLGLTTELISKHLSPTIATALGHQDQEAKHFHPTKPSMTEVKTNQPDMDLAPAAESCCNIICSMVFSTESFCSYSNQTRRFPEDLHKETCICLFFIIMTSTLCMLAQFQIAKQQQSRMHS